MSKTSKTSKKTSKTGKKLGRPRKYAQKKEAYSVYNKKKPVIRVTPEEKQVIEYLRKNPDEFDRLKSRTGSSYSSSPSPSPSSTPSPSSSFSSSPGPSYPPTSDDT